VSVTLVSPRRLVLFAVVLVVTSFSWVRGARAYRPFDQTDADVAETHDVELELGPIGYLHDSTGSTYIPGFILNYGVVHRVELVFDAHHAFLFGGPDVAAHRRQLDTGLFAKAVVREGALQDCPGPSVALEVGALLPTVPLAGDPGMSVTAIVSERWPALAIHLDAEGDYTRDGTFAFIGGFILEGPDAWAVRPVSEFFVARQTDAPVTVSGLAGAIWRARPKLSFDSALRLAHQGSAEEIEIRVGLTWSFGI
jgi:hypothetical protein